MDNFINFAEYSYFRIMYDYIKGRIEELNPTEAVIECCGIGYLMQISLNTYEKIRDAGDTRLYVYHHVREDEETLGRTRRHCTVSSTRRSGAYSFFLSRCRA